MTEQQLTIGELAHRTGVATSALRYWDQIGLLPAPARVSGHRRYPPAAIERVGKILLLQDVGYTLRELKALIAASAQADDAWRDMARSKLNELDHHIAQAHAARTAVAHALACPHKNLLDCPNFAAIAAARLAGKPLADAHGH